jgi:3-hydroxyisobutyrate dehydrogenase-like beta-hydroxyacid dehydrogenase
MTTIGFLGFGEAGSTIARGLRARGTTDIVAYDIAQQTSQLVQRRAQEGDVPLVDDPAALAAAADVIVSAVVCTQASAAAGSIADHLGEQHWYLDINSVAPGVKHAIAASLEPRGVDYVDVAVMANVTDDFDRLPLLLAGSRADAVIDEVFADVGFHATPVSATPGEAARIKMFRSLFVKGLEALSLEAMLACYPTGVHERVLESFEASFGGYTFPELVKHLIERHAIHGERRGNELEEVAGALREVGVDPIMAEAGYERMRWDVDRGLQKQFAGGEDPDWLEVLEALSALRDERTDER